MYFVFQVASDDETTQRNGLVAIYSRHEHEIRHYFELAIHQTESIKFFAAAPLRYSAFHCFLPNDVHHFPGLVLNMVGNRTRLITRLHTGTFTLDSIVLYCIAYCIFLSLVPYYCVAALAR